MRDLSAAQAGLTQQQIELPSWAFGNTGTRFKVFGQPGVPRTPWEKAEDAAQVHRYTGVAPSMAVHIPWDKVDDYAALARHADGLGIRIGTVNANVFQDDDYKLGSACHPDPRVRKKAVAHLLECVDVMDATGSRDLKLWFADGTNYPGQDDIRARQDRLAEALATVYQRLGADQRMLLEYKLFEPSFYTTDVPDWGTSLLHCQALGPKAQVVVDTGHHAPGTNIEFIVALLLRAGRLGGFDFNSRFYADDDLMVGAADPFQLFRIMHEVVGADALRPEAGVAFMLDQCHNIEPKIAAQIRSVMNVQEAIVLVPGVGMFSFGADAQTARVAGEFYLNAINVMRGAEAVSAYQPIDESEKFRIEYWELEEAKLRRRPKPKPLAGRVALVTGGGSGIGRATARRLAAEGACVVVTDRDGEPARAVAGELGSRDVSVAVTTDVTDQDAVAAAFDAAALAFGGVDLVVNNAGLSISRPLLETTLADWDLQHDVMARGSFLVSRQAARVMTEQGLGGNIVYICSKNAVFAGPSNVAYGAAKADQAHQVRLLAAELGEIGVRVNGVNPDGVVRGSGIFASGWGAQRAAVYGVPEDGLGAFYARRTLLKREVLPEHVAAAVLALCAGDLALTTGLLIPVDAGVAAAFLR